MFGDGQWIRRHLHSLPRVVLVRPAALGCRRAVADVHLLLLLLASGRATRPAPRNGPDVIEERCERRQRTRVEHEDRSRLVPPDPSLEPDDRRWGAGTATRGPAGAAVEAVEVVVNWPAVLVDTWVTVDPIEDDT